METAGTLRTARVRSEQDCGSEAISDSITQAVIKSQRPAVVRNHLELQIFARTTDLVNLMSGLSKMRTTATSSGSAGHGPTPMEIGWVKGKCQGKSKNKEKGKGKGKSKGMGKEKPKSEKFEGWCNNCCKLGHKSCKSLAWKRETGAPSGRYSWYGQLEQFAVYTVDRRCRHKRGWANRVRV